MVSEEGKEGLSCGALLSLGATDLENERSQNDKTQILAPLILKVLKI